MIEERVMKDIVGQGAEVIAAHLKHLREHGEHEYMRRALADCGKTDIPFNEVVIGIKGERL